MIFELALNKRYKISLSKTLKNVNKKLRRIKNGFSIISNGLWGYNIFFLIPLSKFKSFLDEFDLSDPTIDLPNYIWEVMINLHKRLLTAIPRVKRSY
jgi:hypothetical protein